MRNEDRKPICIDCREEIESAFRIYVCGGKQPLCYKCWRQRNEEPHCSCGASCGMSEHCECD